MTYTEKIFLCVIAVLTALFVAFVAMKDWRANDLRSRPFCVEWETQPIEVPDNANQKPRTVWVPICIRFKATLDTRKTT